MQNTYEIFDKVIKEKGITAYRVAKDTGLTTVLFTDWKKGKSCPKINKLQLIADYLGVTTDYLLGLSDERSPKQSIQQSSNLTSRESQLLSVFNSLSPSEQGEVLGFAKGLANKSQSDVG